MASQSVIADFFPITPPNSYATTPSEESKSLILSRIICNKCKKELYQELMKAALM
jgi:hypothetical protein